MASRVDHPPSAAGEPSPSQAPDVADVAEQEDGGEASAAGG